MEVRTEIVKAEFANGAVVHIQATAVGGEAKIDFNLPSFKAVTDAIEEITESVITNLQKVKPLKASVEFVVALELGKLTDLLVKGSSTSNLKILLE